MMANKMALPHDSNARFPRMNMGPRSHHLFGPKLWLDVQLKHRLDQNADVMTENLAQGFVDLGGFGFAPQGDSKLAFDHVKRGFDV